ncbi:MAG: transporter substrate-binding domain-containing protein [Ruminococcaceae bacterium]|nr:transporter substrate-binding domain-containing protein [Oscillospiraceae bacterium]
MKRILTIALAVLMIAGCVLSFASCSNEDLKFGKSFTPAEDQMSVLLALNAKTIDVGVMDSVMAGYYMSQDTEFANSLMIVEGLTLATEQYGIAARKGSGLADAVSAALIELAKDGKVAEIATKYGLQNEICIDTSLVIEEPDAAAMEDFNYVMGQGKMIVGYTDFAPISYKDANGNLVGFDVELAKAVAALFNIEVEFKLINWNTKEAELESKAIDLIWNGMTITPERQEKMAVTIPYMNNKQVAVIRKADQDKYKTTDDMKKAIIGAEDGSAGMSCVVKEKEEE